MRPTRILVVDDDAELRTFLAEAFRLEGYEVVTASNGEEALTALDQGPFDALFVDLMMPVMDGIALRRVLHERRSPTPFIAMTAAYHQPAEVAQVLDATAYLLKPFDVDAVLATVHGALIDARR